MLQSFVVVSPFFISISSKLSLNFTILKLQSAFLQLATNSFVCEKYSIFNPKYPKPQSVKYLSPPVNLLLLIS